MTPVRCASDSDVHSYTMAALSWLLQDREKIADRQIANLDDVGKSLAAWTAVNWLQSKLATRHAELVEAATAQLAAALLLPDSLPDGVVGFPIYGRRVCDCGLVDCQWHGAAVKG